ncbi:Rne/Rng family ribonuclease [Antarctobacter jejuensis]|uniref:Rne/Rng family ribonuclease n=1 Tax=Antarctobacter jejuensis TaxID=1439938 RepID=UPI003FD5AD6D
MPKKMLIDATHAEETRVVVVDGNKVEEFDFESENKRQLAGNIYLAKVTRVEPSLQAAFVDYGGNRHGFLAFSEIHPDYYQIPIADRQALMAEEEEAAKAAAEEEDKPKKSRSRSRKKSSKPASEKSEQAKSDQPKADKLEEPAAKVAREPSGMETIDLDDDLESGEPGEGLSPMETVHETPVEEPVDPEPQAEPAPVEEPVSTPVEEPVSTPEVADPAPAEVPAPDTTPETDTIASAAPEDLSPLEPMTSAEPVETAELDASDDAVETDTPPRPIAEGTKGEDEIVTQEPEGAEPSEDPAPEQAETPEPEAPEPQAETAEAAAKDVSDEAETSEDDADDSDDEDEDDDNDGDNDDAASRDASIESVADDDTEEDIRPVRKPRPRRYKIQEVIKVRQIMLVQVVKEERGNKGAALTTYLSLAGRYCVLMPNTARGGGISRKITNAADRSKLKTIANEIDVPKGAGLIIRTAGAKRTKTEIKRDYEYLQRLWEQIRALTLQSIAPAKIYEEGDLIKRSIRDLYSREIDEVWVEGERGYRTAKDFMKMIMPSHAKNVKHYTDQMPLFARYQVESYLGGMFNPTVQLKSGGYIVIGVTEALVAIDVNSGRATKEGSIEETATKTNLEAAEEVARQLRLRDLAGLIVIDFIDMDERKNNAAVEKKLKDKLKTDRARIQVGRISGFGLLEMSRQRLRPGMIEATTQPCAACHGTGLIRSDDNMALQILRQIEEEGVRRRSREVLVKCPVGIANYLMNQKREHVAMIEARYGMSVRIEGDPHLVAPDFSIEKFKTATRVVPEATAPVVSVDTSLMDQVDEDAELEAEEEEPEAEEAVAESEAKTPENGEDGKPKKRRRRRRRRSKGSKEGENGDSQDDGQDDDDNSADADKVTEAAEGDQATAPDAEEAEAAEADDKPKPKRTRSRSRSRSRSSSKPETDAAETPAEPVAAEAAKAEPAPEAPQPELEIAEAPTAEPVAAEPAPAPEPKPEPEVAEAPKPEPEPAPEPQAEDAKPKRTRRKAADIIAAVAATPVAEAANGQADAVEAEPAEAAEAKVDTVAAEAAQDPAPEPEAAAEEDKPKRRGWWSLGR